MNNKKLSGNSVSVLTNQQYLEIFEQMEQGFYVVELLYDKTGQPSDYRFLQANITFEHQIGLQQAVTGKLGSEVFPAEMPNWLEAYDWAIKMAGCLHLEHHNALTDRWYDLMLLRTKHQNSRQVAVITRDVTERKQAETALYQNQEGQAFLLRLTDALRNIADPTKIQQVAARLLGEYLKADRVHYSETEDGYSDPHAGWRNNMYATADKFYSPVFNNRIMEGWKAGQTQICNNIQLDSDIPKPESESVSGPLFQAYIAVPLMKEDAWTATLAVHSIEPREWASVEVELVKNTAGRVWEILERRRTEEALQRSEHRFRTFVSANADLVYRMSPDWQEMYTFCGKDFLKDTIQTDKNWVDTYIPEADRSSVWKAIHKAIRNKQSFEFEHRIIHSDGTCSWTSSSVIPLLNNQGEIIEWFGAATDITMRKQHEVELQNFNARLEEKVRQRTAELKESRDQLQSIFDTSLVQMSILHAVRGNDGTIIDLLIILVNKELERVTGRNDLVGKFYVEEFPGIVPTGLFELIVRTIETGEPQHIEYFYPHDGFHKWFSCMFVKLDDGVVATNIDITSRKKAEEGRFKNYILLKQSEDIALLGSWDYDLQTGNFMWSDGMYRLFNLKEETEINPEIYLKYATANGHQVAERVVKQIKEGKHDFEETLELKIDGKTKIIRLKACVVKDKNQQPVRMLGVDRDITAMRAAEETIRQMEAEQRLEVFRVSLSTLEEERQRISESLHNGIGQILYGIKISLSGLTQDMPQQSFNKTKKYTSALLTDAIQETRRVSHELMPFTLEEFGLKRAVYKICQQLSDGVTFNCKVTGLDIRLEKYFELAIYRTIQELMTNVVKHSGATEAEVELDVCPKKIFIRVQDNGRGMEATKKRKPGIGLASIRSKIKLLNGKLDIYSEIGAGTRIDIVIPLNTGSDSDRQIN